MLRVPQLLEWGQPHRLYFGKLPVGQHGNPPLRRHSSGKWAAMDIKSSPQSSVRTTEQKCFVGAFSAFTLLALAPIWLTKYAPLPDTAVHLASASIWAHLHRPEYEYSP